MLLVKQKRPKKDVRRLRELKKNAKSKNVKMKLNVNAKKRNLPKKLRNFKMNWLSSKKNFKSKRNFKNLNKK